MSFDDDIALLHRYSPMLYVPGDRPSLERFLLTSEFPFPFNLTICLEDAVAPDQRKTAAVRIASLLEKMSLLKFPVFVRPPDETLFEFLLDTLPLEKVSGFILPKASVERINRWIDLSNGLIQIMPILEAAQVLDSVGRRDLSQACSAHRMVIPCARIGANDLLSLMGGLRRPRGRTIYETPVGKVIDGLIEAFCLSHLPLCAPVYEHFSDVATFKRELKEDVYRGLYSKTAIHPEQIGTIWDCYIPEKVDLEDAIKVTSLNCPPIVSSNGSMLEKACHQRWAKRIMELDRIQRAYLTIDRKYSK